MSTDKRMAIKPALNQFNGGEISPYLEGRYDWDKYNYSAKLCKNFIPTVEGYLKRRGGSHFIARKKGSTMVKFKIYVKLTDNPPFPTPVMSINDTSVTLTNTGEFFPNDTWVTEEISCLDGTALNYNISATGYITKIGTLVPEINQTDVTINLNKASSDTATITFVAPTSSVITLNGTTTSTITDTVGTSVTYSVSYSGKSATGTLTIDENKKYYVFVKDDTLVVSDSLVIKTSSPNDGTLYLPQCKIRYIGVGGGGGACGTNTSGAYISGGSGAGCDIVLNISEGSYEYNVGRLGDTTQALSPAGNGSNTYLKKNNSVFVNNGGGHGGNSNYGGSGGTNTINESLVASSNWVKKGNGCSYETYWGGYRGSRIRGASVYGGYGTGSGHKTEYVGSFEYGTNGYLYISFVE